LAAGHGHGHGVEFKEKPGSSVGIAEHGTKGQAE
jgi:hypothetical protein